MKSLWLDVKKWLGATSQTVIKEAEFLTRKGKIKLELYELNRHLEKVFADLGGEVYHRAFVKKKRKFLSDKEIKDKVALIKKLEATREEKKTELKLIDGAMDRKIKK